MNAVITSGEWQEERLYVLRTIEDLKAEQKRQSEQAAIERASVIDKSARDISAAHDKIRKLEGAERTAHLKTWILTGALSAAVAFVFELIKAYLHNK